VIAFIQHLSSENKKSHLICVWIVSSGENCLITGEDDGPTVRTWQTRERTQQSQWQGRKTCFSFYVPTMIVVWWHCPSNFLLDFAFSSISVEVQILQSAFFIWAAVILMSATHWYCNWVLCITFSTSLT